MLVFTTPTPTLTSLLIIPAPFLLGLVTLIVLILVPVLPTTLPQLKAILPSKRSNLPREYFGLAPRPQARPSSPIPGTRDGNGFSLRAKVLLLLTTQAIVSLVSGWAWLISLSTAQGARASTQSLLAISVTLMPATVLSLAAFHLLPSGISRVSHATLRPRIVPIALAITLVPTVVVNVVEPRSTLLATSSSILGLAGAIAAHNAIRGLRIRGVIGKTRAVRKRYQLGPRPDREKTFYDAGIDVEDQDADTSWVRGSSWLTSPSHPGTLPSSSFSYSPEPSLAQTPRRSTHSPTSWLSSPVSTPASMPAWSFSDTPSPQSAVTRPRSPSGHRPSFASERSVAESESGYMPSVTATPATRRSGDSLQRDYSDPFGRSSSSEAAANAGGCSYSRASSTWTASFHSAMSFANLPPPPPLPQGIPLPPTPKSWQRKEREWDVESVTPKQSTELLISGSRDREWVTLNEYDADGLDFEWGRNVAARRLGAAAVIGLLGCWALCLPLYISRGTGTTPAILYLLSLVVPSPILVVLHFMPTTGVALPSRPSGSTLPSQATLVTPHRSRALISDSQLSLPMTASPRLTPPEQRKATPPNSPANARWSQILAPKPAVEGFQGAQRSHSLVDRRRPGDIWVEAGHALNNTSRLSRALEMLKPVPALQVLPTTEERSRRPASQVINRLRDGVGSLIGSFRQSPSDVNRLSTTSEAPPRPSNVTIEVSSPSKFDRARDRVHSGSTEAEYDTTYASVKKAEVLTAVRARMSSSPTFLFALPASRSSCQPEAEQPSSAVQAALSCNAEKRVADPFMNSQRRSWGAFGGRKSDSGPAYATPEQKAKRRRTVDLGTTTEYELDWISAALLPGLLPDVKLGKMRVQPQPVVESPPPRPSISTTTTVDGLPDFRPSQDFLPSMTPHSHRSHGYSSSIDLSQSPDFHHAALASTPKSSAAIGMRKRLGQHRSNASLPHFRPEGFADEVECQLAQVVITDSPLRPDQLKRLGLQMPYPPSPGEDLPPFPATEPLRNLSKLSISVRGLTPVSERDEVSSHGHSPAPSMDERTTQLVVNEMERMLELDSPARSEFIASGSSVMDSSPEMPSRVETIPSLDDSRAPATRPHSSVPTQKLLLKRSDDTIASYASGVSQTSTAVSIPHLATPSPAPLGSRPSRAELQLLPKKRSNIKGRSSIVILRDGEPSVRAATRSAALKPTPVSLQPHGQSIRTDRSSSHAGSNGLRPLKLLSDGNRNVAKASTGSTQLSKIHESDKSQASLDAAHGNERSARTSKQNKSVGMTVQTSAQHPKMRWSQYDNENRAQPTSYAFSSRL